MLLEDDEEDGLAGDASEEVELELILEAEDAVV